MGLEYAHRKGKEGGDAPARFAHEVEVGYGGDAIQGYVEARPAGFVWACSIRPRGQLTCGDSPATPPDHKVSSLVVAILLATPRTQRYFTGAVAEGVPAELITSCPEWGAQGSPRAQCMFAELDS